MIQMLMRMAEPESNLGLEADGDAARLSLAKRRAEGWWDRVGSIA